MSECSAGCALLLAEIVERLKSIEQRIEPDPLCLSFPAAAARLGVGLTKLKRMVKNRELRATRVGSVPMVALAELHRITTPETERPQVERHAREKAWVPISKGLPRKAREVGVTGRQERPS